MTVRSVRIRLKDRHAKDLLPISRDVNVTRDYDNELGFKVLQHERRFLSTFDPNSHMNGATREGMNCHPKAVQAMIAEDTTRRRTVLSKAFSLQYGDGHLFISVKTYVAAGIST